MNNNDLLFLNKKNTHNKTLIVSAFPACGKTYYDTKGDKYDDYFTTLDLDSSNFSWVLDEKGNPTKERNPEFPMNYIESIKGGIGVFAFIFVSSHDEVRKALEDNCIDYVTVMPLPNLKDEWIDRCIKRGNSDGFINILDSMWDSWTGFDNQRKINPSERVFLQSSEYISDILFRLDTYRDYYPASSDNKVIWDGKGLPPEGVLCNFIQSRYQEEDCFVIIQSSTKENITFKYLLSGKTDSVHPETVVLLPTKQ